MQKGDRWPHRDFMCLSYGADRPMSAICTAERTYKLLKDAQDGDGVDIELQTKVVRAIDMLCQRLFNEFNPEYFSQMVGLLRKFLKRVDERFIDPGAETGLSISESEHEPKRAWEYWLKGAREQLCLAEYALGIMQEHRSGFKRVDVNGKEFMVRVNPLVFRSNAQLIAAASYKHPGLVSWSCWLA